MILLVAGVQCVMMLYDFVCMLALLIDKTFITMVKLLIEALYMAVIIYVL